MTSTLSREFFYLSQEEIDEDEAIRKILEDGRKPVKSQGSPKDEKVERESRRRRYSTESSSDSSDDSRWRRRRRRSRSRSRSKRSRSMSRRRSRKRRSRSSNREDGELGTSEDSGSDQKPEVVQEKFKRKRKKKKGNEYEGESRWGFLTTLPSLPVADPNFFFVSFQRLRRSIRRRSA